ncbi:adenylate kinase, partial [Thermoanaerobacter ethanolicus JW 200]
SQTKPLIEYYTKKNILVNIDGNKSVEEVFEDIKRLWETEANDIYQV